ncbi:DUF3592 domain-containing protein [Kosakonia sp. SMBL-WEM22]|uniref:DUF3592 domain-containing protein n=1 Tax=Kosakonia sp. SMBL-WEM22 TaxID=2725560 RepID=UPI001658EA47|nr:DUF3592 domain-containing protein [Kosakonia sp. SMBL-WEM22]QNQ21597.1 DUF3592 domain-containing protein [Kosakonia sp. SMBL-WEM22]
MEFHWIYLIFLFSFLFMVFVLKDIYASFGSYIRQMIVEAKVWKTGIAVNADIIARSRTGLFDANIPVYRLTFKFTTLEGVEVESTLRRSLDAEGVMRYAPGNGATLKYDPKNPKRIAMDDKDRPLILGD